MAEIQTQDPNVDPLVATAEKTHNIIENNKKVAAARAQDPLQANPKAVGPKQGLNPVDVREETSFLSEPEGEAVVAQDEYDTRVNREKAAQRDAAKQRVLERIKKMRDAGYTDDEHYGAAVGNDWAAFFDDSANPAANKTASIFGLESMWGRLTKEQRGYIDQLLALTDREEANKKNIAEEKARQAWEDKYKFTVGEGEGAKQIHVSKEFSDKIKGIGEALARVEADDEKRGAGIEKRRAYAQQLKGALHVAGSNKEKNVKIPDMPEDVNKGKRQQLVSDLRAQLTAAGFDLGAVPEGGEYDSVEDLLDSIHDWETENAVRRAIGMAGSRTEYAPEQKSFEQMREEREKLKEEAELLSRNRELERAKNRQGFAGLAATIGDMIRASQGAPVSPRDWQQMYDNLSAQEKANIDNYRVRMQKINDDARAARLMREKMAAEAAEKDKERQWKTNERLGKEGFEGDENEKNRLAGFINILAKPVQPRGGSGGRAMTNINAFGNIYDIESSQNTNTLTTVAGMLKNFNISLGIKQDVVGVDRETEARTRTLILLQNLGKPDANGNYVVTLPESSTSTATTVTLTKDQVDEIKNYLAKVSKGVRPLGSSGPTPSPSPTPTPTQNPAPTPSHGTPR